MFEQLNCEEALVKFRAHVREVFYKQIPLATSVNLEEIVSVVTYKNGKNVYKTADLSLLTYVYTVSSFKLDISLRYVT